MIFSDLAKKMISCAEIDPPLSFQEIWDFISCELPENPVIAMSEGIQRIEERRKEWERTDYGTKKRINEEIRTVNREIEEWMDRKRKKTTAFADIWIEDCLKKKKKLRARLAFSGKIKTSDDKAWAKLVPIDSFLTFNSAGFASCVFHKIPGEKSTSPSLKYYPIDNHCYCFSCTKRGDSIECMMAKEGIDFTHAIKRLLL